MLQCLQNWHLSFPGGRQISIGCSVFPNMGTGVVNRALCRSILLFLSLRIYIFFKIGIKVNIAANGVVLVLQHECKLWEDMGYHLKVKLGLKT